MSAEKAGTLGASWGEENLTWWEKRSKLEKKLIVALIVGTIILCGILIFYSTKPRAVNSDSVCSSSACLEAASLIVTHIDTSIDPCDDFFKFACGKFIEHTHGDLKATSIKEIKAQVRRQIEEIINEPINDDDHASIKKQKQLLHSCLNETAAEEEALEILQEHLQELNGWPVVVGYKWRERYFDWLNMIIKLKRFGFPYEMLLSFSPIPDPTNSSKIILMIDWPYVSETKEKHKELYKATITDIAVALGADRNRAILDMEKVLDFKEKLYEIVKKNRDLNVEDKKTEEDQRSTIKEFQEYNNEIDWLDFINNLLYPAANVTNEDYVVFPKNEFMEDFFGLIYKTPKRIQANYIIWSAIEPMIGFLPKRLQQIVGNYSCQTRGPKTLPDRKTFCSEIVLQSYTPKASDIIYARKYLPEEEREQVQEILTNVKNEFVATLNENSWMDDESKENAVKKVESVKQIIGAPGDYFNDSIFDVFEDLFPDESDEESTFFERILFYAKLESNYIFANIEEENEEKLLFYHMATMVNAYLVSNNYLMVPVAILQGIMFDYERPMYLNYGSVGTIIGHEFTHALAHDCDDIKQDEIWTEKGAEAFKESVNCIIESAENFNVEGTNNTINGTQTLDENIADFTGTKLSYRAYKKWMLEHGEEPQLPGIEYTPEQLFWIASILHECYKLSGEKLEQGLEFDSHANNAFRATGPIRNNPDFAKDFNCPVDSNMNPSEKCQIF